MAAPSDGTRTRTIKTRVLIISDTHCAQLTESNDAAGSRISPPFEHPLPDADLLIHCGDLTYRGDQHEFHQTLDMLSHINAPVKLVIAGNHDLSLDKDFLLSHSQNSPPSSNRHSEQEAQDAYTQARALWTGPTSRARKENITFLDEGTHTVPLANGAVLTVYATPYTPEFCDWAFPYARDEDRFNPTPDALSDARNIATTPVPADGSVDIMITHGPPWGRLDRTNRGDYAGCPHLLRAVMRVKPLVHCFEHIHEGWGAERVRFQEGWEQSRATIKEYKDGGWREGVEAVEKVEVDGAKAVREHAVGLDLTTDRSALVKGRDTLLVNAAIMTVAYQPENAPWLLELDLPAAE